MASDRDQTQSFNIPSTNPLPNGGQQLPSNASTPHDSNVAGVSLSPTQPFDGSYPDQPQRHHGEAITTNLSISHKILNEAYLICNRRICSSQQAKKNLELMCEAKVSKYKLEEVHCSLPSTIKSTFIMTFSPDGQKVASTHGDHRIYICDLNTGKLLDTLDGHPKTPWCLAWHPSNREILASGCLAGEVRVWDLKTKACEAWTSDNNTIISSLDFHPKERILVIATANDIHFWDWSESHPFSKTTTTHDREKVKFVVFDSSGTKLITGITNLPKFAGYSNESLQNRIIDDYITHGTYDQHTDNMTQNSEMTNQSTGSINPNDIMLERNLSQSNTSNSPSIIGGGSGIEQDVSYRSTNILSRIAALYRQLEGLEDSMRNTTFTPYVNPRPISSPNSVSDDDLSTNRNYDSATSPDNASRSETTGRQKPTNDNVAPSHGDAAGVASVSHQPDIRVSNRSTVSLNAFEPFVVAYDESLDHLQLTPLIVDGQPINLTTVVDQYPLDLPNQVHFIMQFESINQVNQNFIRISKLMSSARLYRQIVQQILSSSSGQGHYLPNQILTAQSASPRSARQTCNLPYDFRNVPYGAHIDSIGSDRSSRTPPDPILAIQFRNSARNVPLVTICKIDLLSARSVVIMRSQQLIEQTIESLQINTGSQSTDSNTPTSSISSAVQSHETESSSARRLRSDNLTAHTTIYPLLYRLNQTLTIINHTPLTTSNVHTHIVSLRGLTNRLLANLTSMFQSRQEAQRTNSLIHDIAFSLTGRRWDIPLGATLDDIRLDVIHTLCIVDLTLHLARQVQLLQMQRLSAYARIEESKRSARNQNSTGNNNIDVDNQPSVSGIGNQESTSATQPGPSSAIQQQPSSSSTEHKRKEVDLEAANAKPKRIRLMPDTSISSQQTSSKTRATVPRQNEAINLEPTRNDTAINIEDTTRASATMLSASADATQSERLVLLNNAQTQSIEQSLQRLLLATSNISNSHVLVRIYHRATAGLNSPSNSSNVEIPNDVPNQQQQPPVVESRRRAMSQDNMESSLLNNSSSRSVEPGRARQANLNYLPAVAVIPGGLAIETLYHRYHSVHLFQTRGHGHLWFNHWTSFPGFTNSNFRLQCWNFSAFTIPNIKDSQANIVTRKCRIYNNASVDISSDGSMIACLVPREEGYGSPHIDLKVFSIKTNDFGSCFYQLPQGPNAISVSLSPSASFAVVGLSSNKSTPHELPDDDLTIAKVYKLQTDYPPYGCVREIKIKRGDSSLHLNAIRWMDRGIVYNVGPQYHQRYHPSFMRNRVG